MVLDVTAKTNAGAVVNMGTKEYWEIGLDMDGEHRVGAWQIKEILDLTLPPRKATKERFLSEFPAGTTSADVEVTVRYKPSATHDLLIHKVTKKLTF